MIGALPPGRPAWSASVVALALTLLGAPRVAAAEPPVAPPPVAPARPADPITLDLSARAGFAYRFSDSGTFPITNRAGGVVGASVAVSPSPSFGIGLGWEHSALGSEQGGGASNVELTRSLDVVWASVRLTFVRFDRVVLLAQLGPGLAFQHESASGLPPGGGALFRCQETGAPGLGLRGGLGLEGRLNRALSVTFDALVDNLRLSSDILGTCAPGAGTASLIGLRLGFTYRLDVSRFLR